MSTVLATDRTMSPTGASQFAPPPPYSDNWASERGFTVVRWILGLLLITTAVMKLTGGSGEIQRVALPFVSPRIYSSGVVFELILGLWLISGLARAWSWLIALLFFSLLGYMSFKLGMYGQASCGCFGKLVVSPWWAFAIDVAAIMALLMWRPSIDKFNSQKCLWRLLSGSAVLLLLSSIVTHRNSTLGVAYYRLGGEPNSIIPGVVVLGSDNQRQSARADRDNVISISRCDFGQIPGGWISTEVIQIGNSSCEEFKIVGWKATCDCVQIDAAMPIVVANGVTKLIAELDLGSNVTFQGRLAIDVTLRMAGLESGTLRDIVTTVAAEVVSP